MILLRLSFIILFYTEAEVILVEFTLSAILTGLVRLIHRLHLIYSAKYKLTEDS